MIMSPIRFRIALRTNPPQPTMTLFFVFCMLPMKPCIERNKKKIPTKIPMKFTVPPAKLRISATNSRSIETTNQPILALLKMWKMRTFTNNLHSMHLLVLKHLPCVTTAEFYSYILVTHYISTSWNVLVLNNSSCIWLIRILPPLLDVVLIRWRCNLWGIHGKI